jgi:hypothetical protein
MSTQVSNLLRVLGMEEDEVGTSVRVRDALKSGTKRGETDYYNALVMLQILYPVEYVFGDIDLLKEHSLSEAIAAKGIAINESLQGRYVRTVNDMNAIVLKSKDLNKIPKGLQNLCNDFMVGSPYLYRMLKRFYLPAVSEMEKKQSVNEWYKKIVDQDYSFHPREGGVYESTLKIPMNDEEPQLMEDVHMGQFPKDTIGGAAEKKRTDLITKEELKKNYDAYLESEKGTYLGSTELHAVGVYRIHVVGTVFTKGIALWRLYKRHVVFGKCAYLDVLCSAYAYAEEPKKDAPNPRIGPLLEDAFLFDAYLEGYRRAVLAVVYGEAEEGGKSWVKNDARDKTIHSTLKYYRDHGYVAIGHKKEAEMNQLILTKEITRSMIVEAQVEIAKYVDADRMLNAFVTTAKKRAKERDDNAQV